MNHFLKWKGFLLKDKKKLEVSVYIQTLSSTHWDAFSKHKLFVSHLDWMKVFADNTMNSSFLCRKFNRNRSWIIILWCGRFSRVSEGRPTPSVQSNEMSSHQVCLLCQHDDDYDHHDYLSLWSWWRWWRLSSFLMVLEIMDKVAARVSINLLLAPAFSSG